MVNAENGAQCGARSSAHRLSGKQILVVEDDAFIAAEIVDALNEHAAIVVGPAPNIEAALKLMNTASVAGAILDVNLGKDMIFPVADQLTERGIPIVFQTAFSAPEAIQALYPQATVLKKPTCRIELINCMVECVERS